MMSTQEPQKNRALNSRQHDVGLVDIQNEISPGKQLLKYKECIVTPSGKVFAWVNKSNAKLLDDQRQNEPFGTPTRQTLSPTVIRRSESSGSVPSAVLTKERIRKMKAAAFKKRALGQRIIQTESMHELSMNSSICKTVKTSRNVTLKKFGKLPPTGPAKDKKRKEDKSNFLKLLEANLMALTKTLGKGEPSTTSCTYSEFIASINLDTETTSQTFDSSVMQEKEKPVILAYTATTGSDDFDDFDDESCLDSKEERRRMKQMRKEEERKRKKREAECRKRAKRKRKEQKRCESLEKKRKRKEKCEVKRSRCKSKDSESSDAHSRCSHRKRSYECYVKKSSSAEYRSRKRADGRCCSRAGMGCNCKKKSFVIECKSKQSEESRPRKRPADECCVRQKSAEDCRPKKKPADECCVRQKSSEDGRRKKKPADEFCVRQKSSEDYRRKKKPQDECYVRQKSSEDFRPQKKPIEQYHARQKSSEECRSKKKPADDSYDRQKSSDECRSKKKPADDSYDRQKSSEYSQSKIRPTQERFVKQKSSEELRPRKKPVDEYLPKQKSSEEYRPTKKPVEQYQTKKKPPNDSYYPRPKSSDECYSNNKLPSATLIRISSNDIQVRKKPPDETPPDYSAEDYQMKKRTIEQPRGEEARRRTVEEPPHRQRPQDEYNGRRVEEPRQRPQDEYNGRRVEEPRQRPQDEYNGRRVEEPRQRPEENMRRKPEPRKGYKEDFEVSSSGNTSSFGVKSEDSVELHRKKLERIIPPSRKSTPVIDTCKLKNFVKSLTRYYPKLNVNIPFKDFCEKPKPKRSTKPKKEQEDYSPWEYCYYGYKVDDEDEQEYEDRHSQGYNLHCNRDQRHYHQTTDHMNTCKCIKVYLQSQPQRGFSGLRPFRKFTTESSDEATSTRTTKSTVKTDDFFPEIKSQAFHVAHATEHRKKKKDNCHHHKKHHKKHKHGQCRCKRCGNVHAKGHEDEEFCCRKPSGQKVVIQDGTSNRKCDDILPLFSFLTHFCKSKPRQAKSSGLLKKLNDTRYLKTCPLSMKKPVRKPDRHVSPTQKKKKKCCESTVCECQPRLMNIEHRLSELESRKHEKSGKNRKKKKSEGGSTYSEDKKKEKKKKKKKHCTCDWADDSAEPKKKKKDKKDKKKCTCCCPDGAVDDSCLTDGDEKKKKKKKKKKKECTCPPMPPEFDDKHKKKKDYVCPPADFDDKHKKKDDCSCPPTPPARDEKHRKKKDCTCPLPSPEEKKKKKKGCTCPTPPPEEKRKKKKECTCPPTPPECEEQPSCETAAFYHTICSQDDSQNNSTSATTTDDRKDSSLGTISKEAPQHECRKKDRPSVHSFWKSLKKYKMPNGRGGMESFLKKIIRKKPEFPSEMSIICSRRSPAPRRRHMKNESSSFDVPKALQQGKKERKEAKCNRKPERHSHKVQPDSRKRHK